jgi:hypothetical protein
MNKKNIKMVAGLLTIIAAAGIATTVMAADNGSAVSTIGKFFGGERGQKPQELTDAQKTEMKTKMDAVQAALEAGDYNAWVAAEKAVDANSPILKKITADNFSNYVSENTQREEKMAAQKVKNEAVKIALEAGDYNAWVTAVKAVNENSSILEKITSSNFSKYVEANKLREQADTILKDLGVDGPEMDGAQIGKPGNNFGHGGPMGPRGQNNDINNDTGK